jgi:hypothetical protein
LSIRAGVSVVIIASRTSLPDEIVPPHGAILSLTADLAMVAAECRDSRNRFAVGVTELLWRARGGPGQPPRWLVDAVAVQLSGFTTQSLAGDLDRTPDQVAHVSARVIEAALASALARPA